MARTPEERRQRLGITYLFIGLAMLAGALLISRLPDPREVPPHPAAAFSGTPASVLVNPFHLHVDPMERLLLVNLERDPDAVYTGFEPQAFDDEVHGTGLIVIGWRHDGRVDVFHQPQVRLDPDTYDIAGDGLHLMLERAMTDSHFSIGPSGVDADIHFEDAEGRTVELRVEERHPRPPTRIGLLAPMGEAASTPSALPLVLMRDFSFVRLAHSEVRVAIDARVHELDLLPVPLDLRRVYFIRYADEPLIATFNPAHSGPLTPHVPEFGNVVRDRDVELRLVQLGSHTAIADMERAHGDQAVRVSFEPPFPNPLDLAPGAELSGRFVITSDPSVGRVAGEYELRLDGSTVHATLVPSEGWRPRERRWPLLLMYRLNPVFRSWPSSYVWEAQIDVSDPDDPTMQASWSRIEED